MTIWPLVGAVVGVLGLIVIVVGALFLIGSTSSDPAVASTTSGKFVGQMVPVNGGEVYRWLGVPYAKNTGGQNRFQMPVPRTSKRRIKAFEPRPPCPQWVNGTVVGSEDCLHMNVWAPNGSSPAGSNRTLVLASSGYWFQRGSNNDPDWAELAFKGGVVVMSPNVRLGVLGFLHPKEGLPVLDVADEDAKAAVKWAVTNAAAFGANPDGVVLVGHGSGAYMLTRAVESLNISSSRAILEGPLPGSVFPASRGSPEPSKELSATLGCANHSTLLSCFTDADLEALLSTAAKMEFRFAPAWCDESLFKTEPQPTVPEVIAGTDIGEAISFLEEYVIPSAEAAGRAGNISDLYDFVLTYFFTEGTAAYNLAKDIVPATQKELQYAVAIMTSGCSTRAIVDRATTSGYHYMTKGTGGPLFEPVVDMAAVVSFVKDGRVPPLTNGEPWHPWKSANTTRLEIEDSSEELLNLQLQLDKLCAKLFWRGIR